jgi:hypothetical protein
MEEGSGTSTNDTSGNSYTATFQSSPTWSVGKIGSGITTDGSDYLSTNLDIYDLYTGGGFTVEAWTYDSASSTYDAVLSSFKSTPYEGFYLRRDTGGSLMTCDIVNAGGFNTVSAPTEQNVWNHWSCTYTSGSLKLYKNGVLQSEDASASMSDPLNKLIIGANYVGSENWNGKLDEVKVYPYARTPAQIAWDFNQGHPISHYKMDECTGSNLNDSSGNSQTLPITIGATGTQTAVGTCSTSGAWFNGATGKYNSSFSFDGTDDYARKTSYPYDLRDRFTISAWIKSSAICAASYYLVELEYGKPVMRTASCKLGITMRDSGDTTWNSYLGNTTMTNDVWYHLATTYDTSTDTVAFYVNGKPDGTATHTAQGGTAATTLTLGGRATVWYPGQMDDVRIYNYALTPTQIKTLYNENSAIRFGP